MNTNTFQRTKELSIILRVRVAKCAPRPLWHKLKGCWSDGPNIPRKTSALRFPESFLGQQMIQKEGEEKALPKTPTTGLIVISVKI